MAGESNRVRLMGRGERDQPKDSGLTPPPQGLRRAQHCLLCRRANTEHVRDRRDPLSEVPFCPAPNSGPCAHSTPLYTSPEPWRDCQWTQ